MLLILIGAFDSKDREILQQAGKERGIIGYSSQLGYGLFCFHRKSDVKLAKLCKFMQQGVPQGLILGPLLLLLRQIIVTVMKLLGPFDSLLFRAAK